MKVRLSGWQRPKGKEWSRKERVDISARFRMLLLNLHQLCCPDRLSTFFYSVNFRITRPSVRHWTYPTYNYLPSTSTISWKRILISSVTDGRRCAPQGAIDALSITSRSMRWQHHFRTVKRAQRVTISVTTRVPPRAKYELYQFQGFEVDAPCVNQDLACLLPIQVLRGSLLLLSSSRGLVVRPCVCHHMIAFDRSSSFAISASSMPPACNVK